MFDLNSWMGSLVAVLLMGGIITAFSAVLTALICRTWGADSDVETTSPMADQETSLRQAA